ncbi:MAG: leucine-rich repeat domain-containing protein [Prevotella sp.]|nr:leucine-rich repeat domain-containing protein [Prevotella sp.]
MKRLLSLFAFLFITVASFAYDVKIGGIYYEGNSFVTVGGGIALNWTNSIKIKTSPRSAEQDDYGNINYFNDYSGEVEIPDNITTTVYYYRKNTNSSPQKLQASETGTFPVVGISDGSFANCDRLISISIPNTVTFIGDKAFYGCLGLTSITIPNSVTRIGNGAFSDCNNLVSVYLYAETPVAISENFECFSEGTYSKATLYVPAGTKEAYKSAECWKKFVKIEEMKPLIINGVRYYFNDDHYEVGNSSENGSGYDSGTSLSILSEISATESNREQNYPVTVISKNAFNGCSGLTSVTIPSSVTSIGDDAFRGCTSLTDVTLNSNSIVSSTSSSLKNIFGTQVKTYTIGESVTTIGERAFSGCSGLTNINIPNSVTSIGEYNQEIKGETNVEIIPVIA